jgi:hypothetical protein
MGADMRKFQKSRSQCCKHEVSVIHNNFSGQWAPGNTFSHVCGGEYFTKLQKLGASRGGTTENVLVIEYLLGGCQPKCCGELNGVQDIISIDL